MNTVEYFTGYLLRDGYLYYYKKEGKYLVRVADKSREFLERIRDEMLKVGFRGHIYRIKGKNAYVLEYSNKSLYFTIKRLSSKLTSSPTASFVAGIIDAEGSLERPKRGSVRLVVSNTNVTLLESVAKYLSSLGIKISIRPYGKSRKGEKQRYRAIIYGERRVEQVLSSLPLLHPKFSRLP